MHLRSDRRKRGNPPRWGLGGKKNWSSQKKEGIPVNNKIKIILNSKFMLFNDDRTTYHLFHIVLTFLALYGVFSKLLSFLHVLPNWSWCCGCSWHTAQMQTISPGLLINSNETSLCIEDALASFKFQLAHQRNSNSLEGPFAVSQQEKCKLSESSLKHIKKFIEVLVLSKLASSKFLVLNSQTSGAWRRRATSRARRS